MAWTVKLVSIGAEGEEHSTDVMRIARPDDLVDLAALLQRLPTAESDRDREQNQAATWNSSAMKLAWARMSRPPMFRSCPFLIIAIAS